MTSAQSNPPDVTSEKLSNPQQQYVLQGYKDAGDCMDYLRVGGVPCPDNDHTATHEESDYAINWNNRRGIRFNSSKGKVLPFVITGGAFFHKPRIHQLEIMEEVSTSMSWLALASLWMDNVTKL